MNKKTVIELCLSPDLGGLELYMVRTANAIKKDFNVISIISENSKLEQYFSKEDNYIKVKRYNIFFAYFTSLKISKIIDQYNVDIIHLHWTKDLPFVVLAKLLSKTKPKIIQSRHMVMTRFKNDFYHRYLYKNVDNILAVTYQVKEQLQKYIPESVRPKIDVIYIGAEKFKIASEEEKAAFKKKIGFTKGSFNIGMVGRINKAKGQYLLIEAVEVLVNKGLDVKAYFVGKAMDDSYLKLLKQQVKEKKLQNHIYFLGFMKDPNIFYQVCDTIVLASKKETFGLVLIEAMQAQTTVIGSNSGGVLEIIDDGKTGLLFESQNTKSLAKAIETLINNPLISKKIAQQGKNKCDKVFSSDKQFNKLIKYFSNECNL